MIGLVGRRIGMAKVLISESEFISIPIVEIDSSDNDNELSITNDIMVSEFTLSDIGIGKSMRAPRIPSRMCYWRQIQSPTEVYDAYSVHYAKHTPKYHNRQDNRSTALRAKVHTKRKLAKRK